QDVAKEEEIVEIAYVEDQVQSDSGSEIVAEWILKSLSFGFMYCCTSYGFEPVQGGRGRLAHRRSGDGLDGGGGTCGCGKVSALVLPAATKGKEVMDCGGVMVLGLPEVERKGQRGGSQSWGK
ncbi:hypothetical protein Ancab_003889, partial [Ancistrocladus abbreviatus]